MAAPTIRTQAYLLSRFIVNGVGAIVPQDDDDFIASTFGFFSLPRNPGPQDDSAGTGGAGAFFDTGSRWMNSLTKQWFKCLTGAPGAAVWQGQAFDGEAMGGRLAGTFPNPALAASGVTPGSYGDSSHYAAFTVQADGTITAASEFPFTPPPLQAHVAKLFVPSVSVLSGLQTFGAYTLVPGDIIVTQVTGDPTTLAPYVAAAGAWSFAPWFPAGATHTEPVYVWLVQGSFTWAAGPALWAIAPLWNAGTSFPPSWTQGVDALAWIPAEPGTEVASGGSPIGVSSSYLFGTSVAYVIFWNGPVTLDQWSTLGGPLSPANVGSGALNPLTTIDPTQLVPGTFPSGVLIPYTQVTGAPPGLVVVQGAGLFTNNTNTYLTVFTAVAANGMCGYWAAWNVSGTVQCRIRVADTKNSNFPGGSQVNDTFFNPGTGIVYNTIPNPPVLGQQGPLTSLAVEFNNNASGSALAQVYFVWFIIVF